MSRETISKSKVSYIKVILRWLFIWLIIAIIMGTSTVIGYMGIADTIQNNLKEQYYRGAFDLCMYATMQKHPDKEKEVTDACFITIDKMMKKKWHELPSKNWKWPVKINSGRSG